MSITTCFDHSVLFCSTNPNSPLRFKFTKYHSLPTVLFGGKPFKSLSPSLTAKALSDTDQECKSYGRRSLLFMISLLPSLQKSTECSVVNAADSDLFLIQGEVRKVLSKTKAAGVLRLVFHDAGTYDMDDNSGGMNGSIVYELDRPENGGLKKPVKVLDKAKNAVEMIQSVSWADMIAVAGAEAVSLCGGPIIAVQLGRLDSVEPDPEGKLPEETLDAFGLKKCFQRKGFS